MRETRSSVATRAFLHAHGIFVAPEALDELVTEAIARMRSELFRSDPHTELTPAECETLERGGFDLSAEDGAEDPLARTAAEYAALLETSLTTVEAAKRLGVAPSRIRQRLTSMPPSLYGIRLKSGWRLPELQFDGDHVLPGLSEVVARLDSEVHPVAVYRWFGHPHPDLLEEDFGRPLSPREWLRLGLSPEPIAELAGGL